uniref:Kunitz/Bovine pancreatic trypsin inhibitor domain protein n=1 Tax=Steinernema glaseri TaxID=37863 RepID=A0A1I7ZLT0_9BILA
MFSQLLTITSFAFLASLSAANDVCSFPRDKGEESCDAQGGLKFYFDVNTGVCQPFRYSGCGGNENRFDTAAKCRAACMTGKATGTQAAKAPAIKKCASGVRSATDEKLTPIPCSKCPANHTCENGLCCPSKEAVCSLDYDAGHYGTNLSHIPRYFYSQKYGNCMLFTYYGLFGNYNNFETYNECVKFCKN